MPPKKDKSSENSDEMAGPNLLESLSENLIHHILNFLNPVDGIRFSILSKSLRSSWLSCPLLDYDFNVLSRKPSCFTEVEFFNFVNKSLQLRGPYIKPLRLERLRFIYNSLYPRSLQNVFKSIVEFALDNNAKELEVDIRPISSRFPYQILSMEVSVVLKPVFSLQCLTILKLEGFAFSEPNLDLTCPSVEMFAIDSCAGLKNIKVSSACSRLRKFEITHCIQLKNVLVYAENVESFSYAGTGDRECQLDISACSDSLKDLTVTFANVYQFLQHIDKYVLLEHLDITMCRLSTTMNIVSSNLKTLKLNDCHDVEKLVVSSKNLESFAYHNSRDISCGIEISECSSLTRLELCGARHITAGWLRDTISALTKLEMLSLRSCAPLEEIEFKHDKLKRLVLENLNASKMVEIDARNLLDFSFSGRLEPFPLVITSSQCNVIISLKEGSNYWFRNLSEFLKYFNHCPSLTLSCSSAEDLIFPKEYFLFRRFPLPDMKHLIVELEELPERAKLFELVESVLWIVPNPRTVTIISGTKRYMLKFHFSNQVNRKELNVYCCPSRPFKCWRHKVGRIYMENFEQEDRKQLEELLFNGYLG